MKRTTLTKSEEGFLYFYLDTGWFTLNSIMKNISYNRSNESSLHDSLYAFVGDREVALATLSKIYQIQNHPGTQSTAFKLFYYFVTGDWLDDYRPQEMKKVKTTVASKGSAKAGKRSTKPVSDVKPRDGNAKFPLPLPVQGRDDSECGWIIRYNDDITDEEQVPGLLDLLSGEYEAIIDTACRLYNNNNLREIQVIISKEMPIKTYPNTSIMQARNIKDLFERKGNNATEEEIKAIIDEKGFDDRIVGRYYSKGRRRDAAEGRHIVIYYRNFTANTLQEYVAVAGKVLAHEYMHYVHNKHIRDREFNRGCEEASPVKEAVADFFSVWYMLRDRGISVADTAYRRQLAKERYDLWTERQGTDWPYWYALYFYRVNKVIYPFLTDTAGYERNEIKDKNLAVYYAYTIKEAYQRLLTV